MFLLSFHEDFRFHSGFGTFVSTKSKNVDPSVAGQIWPGLFLPFSRSVPPFRSLGRKMLILFGGLANRGSARLARRVGDNTQTKPHMCDNKLSWPVMPSLKSWRELPTRERERKRRGGRGKYQWTKIEIPSNLEGKSLSKEREKRKIYVKFPTRVLRRVFFLSRKPGLLWVEMERARGIFYGSYTGL